MFEVVWGTFEVVQDMFEVVRTRGVSIYIASS